MARSSASAQCEFWTLSERNQYLSSSHYQLPQGIHLLTEISALNALKYPLKSYTLDFVQFSLPENEAIPFCYVTSQ